MNKPGVVTTKLDSFDAKMLAELATAAIGEAIKPSFISAEVVDADDHLEIRFLVDYKASLYFDKAKMEDPAYRAKRLGMVKLELESLVESMKSHLAEAMKS